MFWDGDWEVISLSVLQPTLFPTRGQLGGGLAETVKDRPPHHQARELIWSVNNSVRVNMESLTEKKNLSEFCFLMCSCTYEGYPSINKCDLIIGTDQSSTANVPVPGDRGARQQDVLGGRRVLLVRRVSVRSGYPDALSLTHLHCYHKSFCINDLFRM